MLQGLLEILITHCRGEGSLLEDGRNICRGDGQDDFSMGNAEKYGWFSQYHGLHRYQQVPQCWRQTGLSRGLSAIGIIAEG